MKEDSRAAMLKVLTAIRFSKRALKEINSITFLFDPNWAPGIGEVPTIPLSMFHVKSQKEEMESEISQKQLIFHNTAKDASFVSNTNGQTEIVADNVVNKPKTYRLEIVLPATGIDSGAMLGTVHPYQSAGVSSFLATGGKSSKAFSDITSWTIQSIRAAHTLYKIIADLAFSNANNYFETNLNFFKNLTDTPNYNKESLEAMWRNRSILKMKTWNDWRYKYVVIKSLELTKEGTASGVYEGVLTLQEISIMTVRRSVKGAPTLGWKNPVVAFSGNQIKKLINSLEGKSGGR